MVAKFFWESFLMASGSELAALREAVGLLPSLIANGSTHKTLAAECEALGLPVPPDDGTKFERASASFDALLDSNLARVAERLLGTGRLDAVNRNKVEDALWALSEQVPIPTRARREIAQVVQLEDLLHSPDRFAQLLDRVWVLDDDPLGEFGALLGGARSLRQLIERHVYRNPGDWTTDELLDRLGAFTASDQRFAVFLEGMASAEVLLDEQRQRALVAAVGPFLQAVGVELRETGEEGGYPVFRVVPLRATRGRPKNLIFASPTKPDLRFSDAIDNDIEIATNADQVLIYDQPIGSDGLRWRDLQAWWSHTRDIPNDAAAKRSLYKRLLDSMPDDSPPQRRLFILYHQIHHAEIPDLPALLPEVWLHWDPQTARRCGRDALLNFRMDFLLLLPNRRRVVLEVDGKHHYATEDRADPTRYARTVRGDRDLTLSGYEVYRFGAAELRSQEQTRPMLQELLQSLIRPTVRPSDHTERP